MKFALLVAAVAAGGNVRVPFDECSNASDSCEADYVCCDATDASDAAGTWCLPVGSASGAEVLDAEGGNSFIVGAAACELPAADAASSLAVGAAAVAAAFATMA